VDQRLVLEKDNGDGEGTCAYYVLVDDVRHPCGLCDKYLGVEIQEVQ